MPYHWQKTPKLNHLQRNMPFQLRIRDFLISKGVEKPYAWLRKVGISHGVAHRLLNNKQDRYLGIIDRHLKKVDRYR